MAGHVATFSGDDIDYAKESIIAIQTGAWPANDLDTVDQVHVEDELGPDEGAIGEAVVNPMAIDQQQNAAVEIAAIKPTHPEEGIVAVIAHV